jgi:hypothetical protein
MTVRTSHVYKISIRIEANSTASRPESTIRNQGLDNLLKKAIEIPHAVSVFIGTMVGKRTEGNRSTRYSHQSSLGKFGTLDMVATNRVFF